MSETAAATPTPTTISVEINIDGTTETVPLDIDLSNPTLQESVIWEEELGEETLKELLDGNLKIDSPKKVRVLLYARLKTKYPDLQISDFDLDYESIASVLP